MKLNLLIILLIGTVVAIMSIQTTHAQMSESETDYAKFEDVKIGLSLEYPADWGLVKGDSHLPFVARIWAPGNTAMISIHHQYNNAPEASERTGKMHLEQYESATKDFEVIESKPILISDNNSAWQLTYSGLNYEGYEFTISEVYATVGNSQYVFSYHVWEGFPDHLPIFNSIVDTVQIKLVDSENTRDKPSSFSYIPSWVENNVKWWNMGKIDDKSFVSGIQFLIETEIIAIPATLQDDAARTVHFSDSYSAKEAINMIKHSGDLWINGKMNDIGFISAIDYLTTQGLVKID